MHPINIVHLGQTHALSHLKQCVKTFTWQSKERSALAQFSVRVRYSNHCYSEEIEATQLTDACTQISQTPLRRFDLTRWNYSLDLPAIIDNLFQKPSKKIGLTSEKKNCHVYELYNHLPSGQRYCVFFSLTRSSVPSPSDGPLFLDLHVESAYLRTGAVRIARNMPFGQASDLTSLGRKLI